MTKGYIIEEIRASVRLRDPDSGKIIEVPLEQGGHWSPTHTPKAAEPPATRPAQREPAPKPAEQPASAKQEEAVAPKPAEPVTRHKRRNGKRHAKASPGTGEASKTKPDEESLASREARTRPVDMQSLSAEDADAWAKLQANLRHMRGRRGGKMGGLGWEETTDSGRSGLLARSGNGAYKILHAGADMYGLFYEWDNGKFERLACGRAEDLMNQAAERAQGGAPEPPPTKLSLELARLVCGNAEQRAAAEERLEPVLREVDVTPDSLEPATRGRTLKLVDAPEPSPQPEKRARRAAAPASEETTPSEPEPPPKTEMPVDPNMDQQLVESLKKALAELEE